MLDILGTPKSLCDGLPRRDFLRLGGLASFGLGLAPFLQLREASASSAERVGLPGFGKAKACILLFPYGAPPQHETFDPKPEAPAEVQGELKAIPSRLPGLSVCERLPGVAGVADRLTVVRSMSHPYPEHGVAYAVSGIPTYTPALENFPRDPRHWPFIGSVVDYLDARAGGATHPPLPRNIGLPWVLNSKADTVPLAGPYAAFLGQAYDPVWADFDGKGTRLAPRYTENQPRQFHDPYAGVEPAGRFVLAEGSRLPEGLTVDRLGVRRSLLAQFDRARAGLQSLGGTAALDTYRERAFALITSGAMRQALDIGREPMALRQRYGMTLFGQGCLAARRLVEAGGRFITVFWDAFGQFASCAWDTHANHYPRLKDYLLPGFDQAFPALILDLESRGLLDETLVLWMGEHGRTPRIDSKPRGAGRHHWSRAYSIAMAGAGVPRGKIVGATDRLGGDVRDTPVSPKDILATALHLLGIDPATTVPDLQGRPMPVAGSGVVRPELLA
jgi:hypothetical protein